MRIEQMVKEARKNSPALKLKKVIEKGKLSKFVGYEFGAVEKNGARSYVVRVIQADPAFTRVAYDANLSQVFNDFTDATDYVSTLRDDFSND